MNRIFEQNLNNTFAFKFRKLTYLFAYFLLMNIAAFAVAGYDKYLAVNGKFRIAEKKLFTIAFCGGSVGLLLAMLVFRHKISKTSFVVKFLVIFALQIALAVAKLSNKI